MRDGFIRLSSFQNYSTYVRCYASGFPRLAPSTVCDRCFPSSRARKQRLLLHKHEDGLCDSLFVQVISEPVVPGLVSHIHIDYLMMSRIRQQSSSHGGGGSRSAGGGGDGTRPPSRENDARSSVPAGNQGVSDEDALQALLSSAQKREKERSNDNNKNDNNRKRGRFSYDRRDDHRRERAGHQEQRLAQNNSYYGPAGDGGHENENEQSRRRQRREEEHGPARVESERDDAAATAKEDDEGTEEKKPPAQKPNFGLSGALAKDTGNGGNMYKGVVLKFQEPPEARAPNTQWRFYVFKGQEMIETLHISKQSAYLCGRNQDICDVYMAHPSLSSQHAVLQYRALPHKETGRLSCQPYIMDLESTNGTFLNGIRVDPARYYQLKKGDVLTFGASKREYVLLTENTTALR